MVKRRKKKTIRRIFNFNASLITKPILISNHDGKCVYNFQQIPTSVCEINQLYATTKFNYVMVKNKGALNVHKF